tara:strand:+ start:2237 stop:2452 length:216 start_codon:yes stop_codon:yes gene_type:complete
MQARKYSTTCKEALGLFVEVETDKMIRDNIKMTTENRQLNAKIRFLESKLEWACKLLHRHKLTEYIYVLKT